MMSQVAGLGPQVGGGETGTEEGERHKIKILLWVAVACPALYMTSSDWPRAWNAGNAWNALDS